MSIGPPVQCCGFESRANTLNDFRARTKNQNQKIKTKKSENQNKNKDSKTRSTTTTLRTSQGMRVPIIQVWHGVSTHNALLVVG